MLIPITLAVLLSFVLAPVVALLRRIGMPRVPSVVLAAVAALGVVVVLGGRDRHPGGGSSPATSRATRTTIEKKVSVVRGYTLGADPAVTKRIGRMEPAGPGRAQPAEPGAAPAAAGADPGRGASARPDAVEVAQRALGPVISPLATTGIVFVVAIFILVQREDLRDRLIRLFGSQRPAPDHGGAGRCGDAAQPLLPDPGRDQQRRSAASSASGCS